MNINEVSDTDLSREPDKEEEKMEKGIRQKK